MTGGTGRNVDDDLSQEIHNKVTKTMVQRQGANKTIRPISKICRATGGVKDILENFEEETGIHKQSIQHTTRSSYADG